MAFDINFALHYVFLDRHGVALYCQKGKWVGLCCESVKAAAQRPYIDWRYHFCSCLVSQQLRRRVVQMAGEGDILYQLLEVVRHADQVQFYDAIGQVNASRVHIPEHETILVNMLEPGRQHSKD